MEWGSQKGGEALHALPLMAVNCRPQQEEPVPYIPGWKVPTSLPTQEFLLPQQQSSQ